MGVGDEEQMKNKQEEVPRTTMVLSVSNEQRGGGSRPINRTFSTGSGKKPVLKGHPLAPVCVTGFWQVFGHFGHRPMPHSVVV